MNFLYQQEDHESHKKYDPLINYSCSIDVLSHAVDDVAHIPQDCITADQKVKIMDMIETLEVKIGVYRD